MGFGRHVDDRAFLGADVRVAVEVLAIIRVDSAAGHPAGGLGVPGPVAVRADGGAIGFERGPVRQVGIEEDLQVGA